MPKILAVTEEMERRAADIGNNAEILLNNQNAVTDIFQNMGRDFSGRIPSLMTERMIAMEDTYTLINETLNGYKEILSNAAKNYEWNDAEAANWTRALSQR